MINAVLLCALTAITQALLQPVLQRNLLKSGFHRDLQTVVRIPQKLLVPTNTSCQCIIRETLPSNVYVDVFQLKSMDGHLGFDYIVPTLDIEKPEYLSSSFSVLMSKVISLDGDDLVINVTLPIHLRYHKPDINFTSFDVNNPDLLIRCHNGNYVGNVLSEEHLQCTPNGDSLCHWKVLGYSTEVDKLTVSVPVGSTAHTAIVVIGTLLVTFGGCFYVMLNIINTKIKED